ncbi:methyltransferase domain-containing protein [Bdellovibrionota bacterium FG-2]
MKSLLDEMRALPERDFSEKFASTPLSTSKKISLLIPAKNATHCLKTTVEKAHAFFQARFPEDFEIILIPTVCPEGSEEDHTFLLAQSLAQVHPNVRCIIHPGPLGKGAALRTGVQASVGEAVLFTDADLPYALSFFDRALAKLDLGFHLVTGNRRLKESTFELPVSLLRLAYRRHRLGMLFNTFARLLLGIETTDTQAGIKAMTRSLALMVFARPLCPGFFFDLEIFLTAQGSGKKWLDLPTVLFLGSEKSTVRILRESFLAAFWLLRIWVRIRAGKYGGKSTLPWLPRLFSRGPWWSRALIHLRWARTPYRQMAKYLPPRGDILDLGCGYGLLAATVACQDQVPRKVVGIDHDPQCIKRSQEAFGSLGLFGDNSKGLCFEHGWFQPFPKGTYSGIALIDVMREFTNEIQVKILQDAAEVLGPGGTLLVREIDDRHGLYKYFARALTPRSARAWRELFYELGFEVRSERSPSLLFSEVLYICEKRGGVGLHA